MNKEFNLFEAPISGISLVEAGAGTGKTYTIASLYIRIILEKGLMPSRILVLTYTEAATSELKSRLRARIKDCISVLSGKDSKDPFLQSIKSRYDSGKVEILKKALYQFDEASISTIHGFCQKLLKEESLVFGVSANFEILADEKIVLQDIVDSYWREFLIASESEFSKALIHFITYLGYSPDKLFERVRLLIGKPYVKSVPIIGSKDTFETIYDSLVKYFNVLCSTFRKEEEQILEILNGEVLNGSKYKNRDRYFREVKQWITVANLPIIPPERLYLFSSFMNGEGKKKASVVPFLETHKASDNFLDIYEKLNKLEAFWLEEASGQIEKRYKEQKKEHDLLTYSDLLTVVEEGISKSDKGILKKLRTAFPVALIDEFQDTDPIQYSIFKQIYTSESGATLFMIGDPKQAIYSFRGADIFTYLKAKGDAFPDQRYSLSSNYRSSKSMIKAVNEFFQVSPSPFFIDGLHFSEAQFPDIKATGAAQLFEEDTSVPPLQFIHLHLNNESAEEVRTTISKSVSNEIAHLLTNSFLIEDRKVEQEDIAVLVRTHFQAKEIQESLREKGIKSIIKSKESVFKSQESDELFLILSAIIDPGFEDGVRAALATEALGFHSTQILELLSNEQAWSNVIVQFLELNRLWKERGFSRMSDKLGNNFSIEFNFGELLDSERRITNWNHLLELLGSYERDQQLRPQVLWNYFRAKKEDENSGSDEELIRLENDEKLVQIVTMHSSKGLEYPIVICPYLWEGIDTDNDPLFFFHDLNGDSFVDIGTEDTTRNENKGFQLQELLSERIRLTYVALTRSESACFVYLVEGKNFELSPIASLIQGREILKERLSDKLLLDTRKYKSIHSGSVEWIVESIRKHSESSNWIFRDTISDQFFLEQLDLENNQQFKVEPFYRNSISSVRRITSFSSLTSSKSTHALDGREGYDYDQILSSTQQEDINEVTIFSLPKGAKTGTLLHELFEQVVISKMENLDSVITEKLKSHGFDEKWKPVLEKLVRDTLDHFLLEKIQLNKLAPQQCLIEMEFHFPVSNISPNKILKIIRENDSTNESPSISGFMKGFIDLIFEEEGKYYILDYKSNFLGNFFQDYSQNHIKDEILHSSYDMQYHIYGVALHRMLKATLKEYKYEDHFGGVVYLFLRGIDTTQKGSGVYFHKPNKTSIEELDSYFELEHKS